MCWSGEARIGEPTLVCAQRRKFTAYWGSILIQTGNTVCCEMTVGKESPAMQETQDTCVQSLGREDTLEEEMSTHSSILAWEIP